ncbi:hypothetical protein [Streptomyces silvisoli]|uniref:Secreted protein n=1 Tax=Streptomyces silvisoli TaxID=3034235 RepID=A0ABT5ZF83_9ACTN|nr:hypothetical protein [Streptomyces silvisoli]MDF3288467.1 hypothetical protein [Streptomyces silvisoli]
MEKPVEERSTAGPFTPVVRAAMGLLGAGSFGTGVCAVFATDNGTGTGVLLAFGGVLLVLALFGNRVESFELGGANLKLRAAAAERLALAEESERWGDTTTAEQLRAEAQALLEAAGPIAERYWSLRHSMRPGRERTLAMEQLVSRARRLPEERPFEPTEVVRWLREGTDGERVIALAMMQASRELRNFEAVVAAIEDSHSAFEQYHAVLLAKLMVDDLNTAQLRRLAETLRSQQGHRFQRDTDRWELSEDILRRVEQRVGTL